jgi:CBS domain-containing protein
MQARDVMTTEVVTVTADTKLREVALLLLNHGISAVPVLNADGAPIGMVSDGDLVTRTELERTGRRDWWLKLLSDKSPPDDEVLEQLRSPDRTAGDVMASPVVTVGEATDLAEVAQLLADYKIKRVPVLKDGHVTGIVSRTDLLGVVARGASGGTTEKPKPEQRGFLSSLIGDYHRPAWEIAAVPGAAEPTPTAAQATATASGFRTLESDFHDGETQQHEDVRLAAEKQRQETAKRLIDTHVSDDTWRQMLQHAREAAGAGATEWLVLRFPNQLCSDGGRAINIADAGWPATLRGEAAELYLRWEQELKPAGFGLSAHVLEFPGGMPGDIGLFLMWGQ